MKININSAIVIAILLTLIITLIISVDKFLLFTGYLSFVISTFFIWNTLQYYFNKIKNKWGDKDGKF